MRIMLASATSKEVQPVIEWMESNRFADVELLITGVGGVCTAYALTRSIAQKKPDIIIQAGIGGSYLPDYPPGSAVLIAEEVFADLGAIEQNELTDVFDMGFVAINATPFSGRMLANPYRKRFEPYGIPFVRGATVNTISSTPEQVTVIKNKYDPVIESMEGAALHYVCLLENIPFLQLRAVSNFAGDRHKSRWKIQEAIAVLNDRLQQIITGLINTR